VAEDARKGDVGPIQGAYVSSQGVQNSAGRRSLLSNPTLPRMPLPMLSSSLRRRIWLRELAFMPNFLKRRFASISPLEQRKLDEQTMLERLTRFFGSSSAMPLDSFQQMIEYAWYLFRTLLVEKPFEPIILRDAKQAEQLRREIGRLITPEMRYIEQCFVKIAENYREKYQAHYGKACKPDHFAEKAHDLLKKLPKPQALRTLQQQARESRRIRQKKKELLFQDSPPSAVETEYQQHELALFEIIAYLQICVLIGHVAKSELLSFMDYFPPAGLAWFLGHDDKENTLTQIMLDKLEFLDRRAGRAPKPQAAEAQKTA
jgi:hypothetical protein